MVTHRRISRTQFLGYLKKLEQEAPVPELKLHQAARQFGLMIDDLLDGAERQHVKRNLVTYTGIAPGVIDQWRAAVDVEHASSRIDQAALGNSHNARVSGVMLTVRSRRQSHPQVLLVDVQGTIDTGTAAPPAERAVIVENLENFLNLTGTLALLPECGLGPEWQEADILYGSGNSITNHLLTPAFQQYHEIGCLFDPDPGGVRMCDTLYQRGDLPPLFFLAPVDLPARLEASLRTIDNGQREQLAIHIRRSPPCAYVGGLIFKTGRHLEQETYLIPPPSTAETPNESGL
ncbi:DUF2220 domain-containing protein [Halomonas sp. MCCC 1A11062]|uniref:DUF2220 domain-containing protein n=1 Tax=Halomonas sp. MCCC 1A11062 TaxID=2733485 RepID=UPI001F249C39|nr:DUF2220 domain-containing protein [Halomonas sp. MCCC 1A11062]MCE8037022.1 hypothetical protein [Halomonas sp. MCCC 1A11062]